MTLPSDTSEDRRVLLPGPAQKVAIHLNEDAASEGDYLHLEIVSFLFSKGISGATVIRGYAGFGTHHRLHTQGAPGSSGDHLPIRIEFLESAAMVENLMPRLIELVTDGVIEVQETSIVHIAHVARAGGQKDKNG
jgi:PII-like signaling protein